jgi:putative RNase toxin 35 of polymorphic toxin system
MANPHWEKLVPDKNWDDIKKIIHDVVTTGIEKPYKRNGTSKTKVIKGHIVEVTFAQTKDGVIRIGYAWVR